ncbi:DUF2336 domain-containing protein [Rhizobium sp. TRM95111]|uniref:DUF2336 domain-containing protein n=1 Tax=Rhizobium alarense TaxID=2846851 RepID=UPI001F34304A|nr:DUF2336 domain-containing protein [Rhizobium alarense]MCF3639796.1 DUF2336 domain-containing protein [Rhizobium alarense]
MPGRTLIINAFLRWVETARVSDRAKAAGALARAYRRSRIRPADCNAAEMAMIFLLDDPAPPVRLALAEALADFAEAPRAVVLPLAADQPEVAAQVLLRSPVLTDSDLVDLAARGCPVRQSIIAHRPLVSRALGAALAEVAHCSAIQVLLENRGADLSRRSLKRIAERCGDLTEIRNLLLERDDLPGEARQALVERVGAALARFDLVRAAVGPSRVERIAREACDIATIGLCGEARGEEIAALVEHLRLAGRLTPAFLMHALCSGKIEFFAAAIVNLSGEPERRVRSILADGREASVRSVFEAAGLARDISTLFAEATLLWRQEARSGVFGGSSVSLRLLERVRQAGGAATEDMLDLVERLAIAEQRRHARNYVEIVAREAA